MMAEALKRPILAEREIGCPEVAEKFHTMRPGNLPLASTETKGNQGNWGSTGAPHEEGARHRGETRGPLALPRGDSAKQGTREIVGALWRGNSGV